MKMKFAWSKNLEMKRKEDMFLESGQNVKNDYQEYCGAIKKVKRHRSAFTTEQVNYLEKEFRKYPYIGNSRRKDVANVLNIPERAVKIWFQNRRMKEKKDTITKETVADKEQAKTDVIDELLTKSASVTNEPSLPVLSINELKQNDNEVASDLRIKKPMPVLTRTDKDESMIETFLKPLHSMAHISTTAGTRNIYDVKIKSETKAARVLDKSPESHKMIPVNQQLNHSVSPPTTSHLPQDLSTYTSNTTFDQLNHNLISQDQHTQQRNIQACTGNMNIPLYLKGYYAQSYIPHGNMIWKPVNVPPIMSTGIPAVTMANSGPQQPNMPSRSCSCDCHLRQYSNPMNFPQISPNTPVQYIITAVPLQNPAPKF